MPILTAPFAIDHDGKRYEAGEPIQMTDEQASPLIALGAELAEEKSAPAKPKKSEPV